MIFIGSLVYLNSPLVNDVNWAKVLAWLFIIAIVFDWFIYTPFDRHRRMTKERDDARTQLESQKGSFTASVLEYLYNEATEELVARVQFLNTGSVRRIIMEVTLTMFDAKINNPTERKSLGEYVLGQPKNATYVETGAPIVIEYREKLGKNIALVVGNGFGLQIETVKPDGMRNFTNIDTMFISKHGGRTGMCGIPISLDASFDEVKQPLSSLDMSAFLP
jgi:hypothetical protein